jgi:hypothetical protein
MARQEATCWHCGTAWSSESTPTTTLQVTTAGVPVIVAIATGFEIAASDTADQRARAQARLEADRWTDEGGSFDSDAPGLHLVTARGS